MTTDATDTPQRLEPGRGDAPADEAVDGGAAARVEHAPVPAADAAPDAVVADGALLLPAAARTAGSGANPAGATRWGRLYGAADSLAIVERARAADALVVVICPSTAELRRHEDELRFFAGDSLPVHVLPDWETLTYDRVSPHQDIVSERLRALHALPGLSNGLLLVTAQVCLQRLPPRDFLDRHSLVVSTGDVLEPERFRERLIDAGYRSVAQVEEHGEFAVRGSILDLFPMSSTRPFRLEFFDDEIDTIRTFDQDTQRTIDRATRVELLPAHEFPMNEAGIGTFRRNFRNAFAAESRNAQIYREVSDGRAPPGIEYYLPLFFDATATLFDYLPGAGGADGAGGVGGGTAAPPVVLTEGAVAAMRTFRDATLERWEQRRHDVERPILEPAALYEDPDAFEARLEAMPTVRLRGFEIERTASSPNVVNLDTRVPPRLAIDPRADRPMGAFEDFLGAFGGRTLVVASSTGRREALLDQIVGNRLSAATVETWQAFLDSERDVCITAAPLDRGLVLPGAGIALVVESQLGAARPAARKRKRATRDADAIIANLADLAIGSPVVHVDHGVGRYEGLTSLAMNGVANEFLLLRYAGEDKLYVPVASLHLISRYSGADSDTAPLHRLGGDAWQKTKRKAAEKAYDVAAELLEIQARRAARRGQSFETRSENIERFAAAFPFEPTPDQATAIDAVYADLNSPVPMDRVVCGDVGFGKTEVAMRAAFVAVDSGKQVAVLVPTTLLARQHYRNFLDRFADWPVEIESLSRFDSPKEARAVLAKLAAGGIDIIIGTHKLLSRGIEYRDLGLVVIDEEHRFGVRHKEHMKALRSEVDILTLTATPIPRTLNMGLAGMRDLSIIATPPQHRHAIKTFVGEWDDASIREACERELSRGGQIYFLHNEVKTIERTAERLREICPQAQLRVAHGQMREAELEDVMVDFSRQRFDLLVATTIIESGIDIPNANTMIINRADKLGLAQLHQLRGRVGRSHHRAYAYLLTPDRQSMTADAVKRLEAIESLEDLGVGFTLATHDLEIRGAGELLGEGQSGQIEAIGFTLYQELLERAVKDLKSGATPDFDSPFANRTEVDLGGPALLPEDYVPDVHQRLIVYKRIAGCEDDEALREMKVELIDRFGVLPPQAELLFEVTRVRQRCEALGIAKLEMNASGGRVVFTPTPTIDVGALIARVQANKSTHRFDGGQVLRISEPFADRAALLAFVDELLDVLAPARPAPR